VKRIGIAETIDGLIVMWFVILLPTGIYGSLPTLCGVRHVDEKYEQMKKERWIHAILRQNRSGGY
jgi:hypothetical protein